MPDGCSPCRYPPWLRPPTHLCSSLLTRSLARFWKCPNGEDCKYRHALPQGYILKSQMKELLEEVG